jgi:hypothetical protein
MTSQQQFYLDRAAEAGASASATSLANVRDRWLLSQATWAEMAARSARGDLHRAKLIAEKAAERDALQTAAGLA